MKMAFAQVAKGYLSTIANKNSFSLITNMRVASVSTDPELTFYNNQSIGYGVIAFF